MNTSELKQTLVARACSYELAQAIADEIDRLRAENARQRAWIDGVMAQGIVGNHLVSGRIRNVIYRPAPFEDK